MTTESNERTEPRVQSLYSHIPPGQPVGDDLFVVRVGEPGSGGAWHRYEVLNYNAHTNPEHQEGEPEDLVILFQNGPVINGQRNGVTIEALLAICQDRLVAFQEGPFACEENSRALHGVNKALMALHERTLKRVKRGVEGKEVA